jgi:hypothetical protein
MNKTLPYLVSICSFPQDALQGMLILIGYAPHEFTPITDDIRNCRKYMSSEAYPGNLHRFDRLYELLDESEMNPSRWIIFTDSFDVKFQKDLPDFSTFDSNEVLVADEGETWGENTWFPTLQEQIKKVNFIEDMKDRHVLNAGTWAMTGKMFMTMYKYMKKRSKMYNDHQWSDQSMFNEFMYGGTPKVVNHPSFCTVLYNNMALRNTIKQGSVFLNKNNEVYSIVHGNGSSKEYFNDTKE